MSPGRFQAMSIQQATSCRRQTTASCRGCGEVILDQFFLMVSQEQWHIQCLKCVDCHTKLDSEMTCFIKNGLVFCRTDYYKRFATKRCASCSRLIDSGEMVMRARDCVYHLECFACDHCKRVLNTGDSFGMSGNKIYCHLDYQALAIEKQIKIAKKKANNGGRQKKRKHELASCEGLAFQNDCIGFNIDGRAQKAKRVRTSFKQQQLLIMKTYFAINHNPDSKDLKQLSLKTGLSKRVLQVWFQNARAKYRRVLTQGETMGHIDFES